MPEVPVRVITGGSRAPINQMDLTDREPVPMIVDEADEAAWQARIEHSLGAIRYWSKRTGGEPEGPEPGSRLAADDARNPSFPTSLVAWSSISNGVDHLGLAEDALLREGGARLRPAAFYTVTRSALVAASQAIWVLSGSQEARLRRVQLLELEEAKQEASFLRDYLQDEKLADDTSQQLVSQLESAASAVSSRHRRLRAALNPRAGEYSVTKTMKDAAAIVTADNTSDWERRGYLFEWRVASADAHSRLWHRQLRPGEKAVLLQKDGKHVTHQYTTATIQSYGQALAAAVLVTGKAFELWDTHRTTH